MNEILISNWNAVVQPEDQIYHLGDFAFCPPDKAANIARRLQGKKHLILGNHDRKKTLDAIEPFFEWVKDTHLLTVQDTRLKEGKQLIWLSHYCHLAFPHQGYGAWHLFGHSHGKLQVPFSLKAIDVGVDSWDYTPVSYDQIKLQMSQCGGRHGI
jgi:calcineurin-like phosphoesterase family protein